MLISLLCPVPHRYLSHPTAERVCLLVGTRREDEFYVERFVPVLNHARNPQNDFAVRASDYEFVAATMNVIGVVHSHLPNMNEWPSENDLSGLPHDWIGAVYHSKFPNMWWYRNGEALNDLWVDEPPRPDVRRLASA